MNFLTTYILSTIIFMYLLYPINKINTILEKFINYKISFIYDNLDKEKNLIIGSSPTQYAIDTILLNELTSHNPLFISLASPINNIYDNKELFEQIKNMQIKNLFIDKKFLFYKQKLKNKDIKLFNENILFFINGFNRIIIGNTYKMKVQTNQDIENSMQSKILYNQNELEYIFNQIDILSKTNINIYLFETPYNQENSIILNKDSLKLIEDRSYFKHLDNKEIIYLDQNLFINLTHLNKYGQKKFTEEFANKVLNEFNK